MTKLVQLLLTLCFAGVLFSQSDRATVTGTVTDPTGAAIPNVLVSATDISTNVKTETRASAEGVYTIPYLVLGTYRVSAEMQGFKRSVETGVALNSGATVRVDLTLEIGTISEQIEVKAAAPQLRQDSAEISQQVDAATILALPLGQTNAGRNILSFAFLTPGAHGDTFDNFKVGGGSSNGVEYVIDGLGASNNTRNNNLEGPGPDSIAEFKVITNSFDAEYGHTTGGLITFVTKSGTNSVHGNFFELLRNNQFDARGAALRQRGEEFLQLGIARGEPVFVLRGLNRPADASAAEARQQCGAPRLERIALAQRLLDLSDGQRAQRHELAA